MADFKAKKELAQEILAELACSTCQDVPGPSGARKNRYFCSNGHMVCEGCIALKNVLVNPKLFLVLSATLRKFWISYNGITVVTSNMDVEML